MLREFLPKEGKSLWNISLVIIAKWGYRTDKQEGRVRGQGWGLLVRGQWWDGAGRGEREVMRGQRWDGAGRGRWWGDSGERVGVRAMVRGRWWRGWWCGWFCTCWTKSCTIACSATWDPTTNLFFICFSITERTSRSLSVVKPSVPERD